MITICRIFCNISILKISIEIKKSNELIHSLQNKCINFYVFRCKTCFHKGDHISMKKGWIAFIQRKKTVSKGSIKLPAIYKRV